MNSSLNLGQNTFSISESIGQIVVNFFHPMGRSIFYSCLAFDKSFAFLYFGFSRESGEEVKGNELKYTVLVFNYVGDEICDWEMSNDNEQSQYGV